MNTRKYAFVALFISLMLPHHAVASLTEQEVTYSDGDISMQGYLVWDDNIEGKIPGILVVHEWWGQNEYARKRARMLADEGYIALAIDMYGNGKTAEHPDDAGAFAKQAKQHSEKEISRFNAALQLLTKHEKVQPDNIAAIGYCFGGSIVLDMARQGLPLKGVVSFHGSLDTQTSASEENNQVKVLVLHGSADSFVPEETITAFKQEMTNASMDYQFISYPNAVHSFTNPGADAVGKQFNLPLAYNKEADQQSWQRMQDFFDAIFNNIPD